MSGSRNINTLNLTDSNPILCVSAFIHRHDRNIPKKPKKTPKFMHEESELILGMEIFNELVFTTLKRNNTG